MKVVQINTVCGRGSTGRIALSISKMASEHNIDNYILFGAGSSDYPLAECIESELYLKFNILKTRYIGKHGFYSKTATRKLIRRLNEIKPDVLHLHNIHGHYLNVELLFEYIKKNKLRVIWTLHDCWAYTGHCAYYDYAECNKWLTGCNKCSQLNTYPTSKVFDRSKTSYNEKKRLFTGVNNMLIVTPSEWLASEVKKSFLKEYTVKVINNGIDLSKFKFTRSDLKEKLGLQDKKIILGICFQLYDRKGGKYLVELSKLLAENEHIVILGLSTQEKLPSNITVLPKTSSVEELAKIYSMADVFANTTLEDNFPTVNIEALACGTPVVTFNSGGSSEIIDDNTGYSVEKGNVEAMYIKIQNILGNEKISYLDNCRNRTEKMYNEKDKFVEYIELYNEV